MARGTRSKGARTKVHARVTTGTAVAFLLLSASAAFAAAAFTRLDAKISSNRTPSLPTKQWKDPAQTASQGVAKIPTNRIAEKAYLSASVIPSTVYSDGGTTTFVGPKNNISLLKFKLSAVGDTFIVKKLRVLGLDTPSTDATGLQVALPRVTLRLPSDTGTPRDVQVDWQSGAPRRADFTNVNLSVAPGRDTVVEVLTNYLPSSGNAALRIVEVVGVDFGAVNDNAFEAVGQQTRTILSSGSQIAGGTSACSGALQSLGSVCYSDDSNVDVKDLPFTYRVTGPIVALSSLSPAGASVPGRNDMLRFTVSAGSGGGVVMHHMFFHMRSTDNATSKWNWAGFLPSGDQANMTSTKFALYATDDMTTPIPVRFVLHGLVNPNGPLGNNMRVLDQGISWPEYPEAGKVVAVEAIFNTQFTIVDTKTFVLKADTTGVSAAADDVVAFDILGDTVDRSFGWQDAGFESTMPHLQTVQSVRGLPVEGNIIRY